MPDIILRVGRFLFFYLCGFFNMNLCNIKQTFADYKTKGWDRIYVLVDVHNTITPAGQHDSFEFINPVCKEVLQWFSKRPEIKLILWTSSYPEETDRLTHWLLDNRIFVSYINANPEAKDTERAYFGEKFYYNIVIDDRAGFEPCSDWSAIKTLLTSIGEWDKCQ